MSRDIEDKAILEAIETLDRAPVPTEGRMLGDEAVDPDGGGYTRIRNLPRSMGSP